MTEKISQPLEKVVSKEKIMIGKFIEKDIGMDGSIVIWQEHYAELSKEVENRIKGNVLKFIRESDITNPPLPEGIIRIIVNRTFEELKKLERI